MKKAGEGGYSVVAVPIVLGLILIFMAFIFEYGRYVTIKHQLQSAVDSAVLAGISMSRVEFKDISGELDKKDNTKVVLLEEKAKKEAKDYFDKSLEKLKLKKVDIDEENIIINTNNNTLSIKAIAQIKGVFATALFNKDNKLTIVVDSKAEPVDV